MNGKNVVVTGAAGGLGSAIALTLAKAGAGVAVLDLNPEGAQVVVDKIKAIGGNAVPIIGDLTRREGAHALFAPHSGALWVGLQDGDGQDAGELYLLQGREP